MNSRESVSHIKLGQGSVEQGAGSGDGEK